jgi:hypothetical protein
MRKCAMTRMLILSLLFGALAWAQDGAAPDASGQDASTQGVDAQDTNTQDGSTPPQPASYDDVATAGQIHGFLPDTWTAGMITLADLQTQEGQDWLNSLTAAQTVMGQTQYVCQNPGPTTTSSDTGDFYFYDLPAGSYVVAACMQTADGHWRSGAQVLSLDAGQDELIALGPSGGPIQRAGEAFIPAFYVGLWYPMSFGPGYTWGWHPAAAWQASVYYHAPAYRSAPLWVRPAPVAVGVRIVVPPYKAVIAGNYHYLAFRNGGFVRESPRVGYVAPPQHAFHPITPKMEVRMSVGAQVRPGVLGAGQASATVHTPQPAVTTRPSPFVSYHPTPVVVNASPTNNGAYINRPAEYSNPSTTYRPLNQNNSEPRPQYTQPQSTPQPRAVEQPAPRPRYQAPAAAPRSEYHPAPEYQAPPAPREEYHAPAPQTRSTTTTKKP